MILTLNQAKLKSIQLSVFGLIWTVDSNSRIGGTNAIHSETKKKVCVQVPGTEMHQTSFSSQTNAFFAL